MSTRRVKDATVKEKKDGAATTTATSSPTVNSKRKQPVGGDDSSDRETKTGGDASAKRLRRERVEAKDDDEGAGPAVDAEPEGKSEKKEEKEQGNVEVKTDGRGDGDDEPLHVIVSVCDVLTWLAEFLRTGADATIQLAVQRDNDDFAETSGSIVTVAGVEFKVSHVSDEKLVALLAQPFAAQLAALCAHWASKKARSASAVECIAVDRQNATYECVLSSADADGAVSQTPTDEQPFDTQSTVPKEIEWSELFGALAEDAEQDNEWESFGAGIMQLLQHPRIRAPFDARFFAADSSHADAEYFVVAFSRAAAARYRRQVRDTHDSYRFSDQSTL